VRAVSATTLVRVGAGAPAGAELAFMAVEASGNLVVSDAKRDVVMRFDPSGHLLSQWGPRLGDTTLAEPAGVAVHGDSFYVLDRGQPRIFRMDNTGRVLAMLSLETLGTYGLNGLAIDADGMLYAADTGRNRILVFSPTGQLLKQVGRPGNDLGGLTQPMMVAFGPDGAFFVADWENNRVERFNASFEATDAFPVSPHPFGVATDQLGRVFVPDLEHRRVQAYTPSGVALGEIGGPGSPPVDVAPKQLAWAGAERPALYALGTDGIVRVDLENTAPPPQSGVDLDVIRPLVIVLAGVFLVFVVLSRRSRGRALAGAALDRPVRLHPEDRAQRQNHQAAAYQNGVVADEPKREHQPAHQDR
jgi:sugar lactone lactonase YvrE